MMWFSGPKVPAAAGSQAMRRSLSVFAAAIALAGGVMAGAARAEVLFSSFGPGESFDTQSGTLISTLAAIGHIGVSYGMSFAAGADASVDEIDLPVSHISGLNSVTVSLWTDSLAGQLGSWTLSNMPAYGSAFTPEAITGINGIHLTGGDTYVLVLATSADGAQAWNDSTISVQGLVYQNGRPNGLQDISAFRVLGTPDTIGAGGVPEPQMWALMLMGFGGLGVALRRRRVGRLVGGA